MSSSNLHLNFFFVYSVHLFLYLKFNMRLKLTMEIHYLIMSPFLELMLSRIDFDPPIHICIMVLGLVFSSFQVILSLRIYQDKGNIMIEVSQIYEA